MKKLLIAATSVGAAIAGLLLYYRKSNEKKQLEKGRNGFQEIDATIAGQTRNMAHTMG